MAKYNLETETTVHVKGMSFGGPSGGESSMGGGNYVFVSDKNTRVGVLRWYSYIVVIVDTDDFVFSYHSSGEFSSSRAILESLSISMDLSPSDYIGQLGNPVINIDMYERYIDDSRYNTVMADSILFIDGSLSDEYNGDTLGFFSKSAFAFLVQSCTAKMTGDDRDWATIESEALAEMESSIEWIEDFRFYFAFPRYNEAGIRKMFMDLVDAQDSVPYSQRGASPMSMFRR